MRKQMRYIQLFLIQINGQNKLQANEQFTS